MITRVLRMSLWAHYILVYIDCEKKYQSILNFYFLEYLSNDIWYMYSLVVHEYLLVTRNNLLLLNQHSAIKCKLTGGGSAAFFFGFCVYFSASVPSVLILTGSKTFRFLVEDLAQIVLCLSNLSAANFLPQMEHSARLTC